MLSFRSQTFRIRETLPNLLNRHMRRKTYRALIILAVVVVLISVMLAIGSGFQKHKSMTADDLPTEAQQPQIDEQSQQKSVALMEVEPPSVTDDSSFEIHFFDVGEADSALIECDGHYMLVDGGNPGSSSFLYSYLKKHGIDYLDYIICSHAHTDHVGGLAGALNYATVGTAYAPVTEYDNRAFNSFVKYLNEQDREITVPSPGDTIMLGVAKITFLGPVDISLAEINHNNASIIFRIEYGSTSFLFTGDAEIEEEISIIGTTSELRSTLLKVAHHGSYTSSSEAFLAAVDPNYAIITVGKDNEYGHPHDEVLERLQNSCSAIYRTDLLGEIVCYSDGATLSFEFNS